MSGIYWLVLIAITGCGIAAERNPKGYLQPNGTFLIRPDPGMAIILTAILILVSGLRYRVGTDYMVYYWWQIPEWAEVLKNIIQFNEGGFSLLSKLSRLVIDHGQSLIFFSAFITIGLYSRTIYKYSCMYLLSMLLYLFMGQWQGSFNGIRQYLAAAILFAGHRCIIDRNLMKYAGIVLVASLFHRSAFVMIIPYFLFARKPDVLQLLILAAGAIILRLSYDVIFSLIGTIRGRVLAETDYLTNEVNILRILVAFVPVVIYLILCDKENHTARQDYYINAAFFNAFAMLASMGSTYLARIGIYTNSVMVIGYGYLLTLIREEKIQRITRSSLLILYLVYWLYSIKAGGIGHFRWIFNA